MVTTFSLADVRLGDVRKDPYPHVYSRDVFPDGLYSELVSNLPEDSAYDQRMYANRKMVDVRKLGEFWQEVASVFLSAEWMDRVVTMFPGVKSHGKLKHTLRLLRDTNGYSIKPHTDVRRKPLSMLFYLPSDESLAEYGTIALKPTQAGFTCDGSKRHEWDGFEEVFKAAFVPNSVFAFERSDISFHGTKPIGNVIRNQLLYNIDTVM